MVNEFLDKFYKCSCEEDALDLMHSHFDRLHRYGDFAESDAILSVIDLNKLSLTLKLGLLSITSFAKDKLPSRDSLCDEIENWIDEHDKDRKAALLSGLR